MPSARIARTLERLRAGELSAPTPIMRFSVSAGTGDTCRGCDDVIARLEQGYYVRAAGGGESFGLHLVCAEAWIRFNRRPVVTGPVPLQDRTTP